MQYNEKTMLSRAIKDEPGVLNRVNADEAGWEFLSFEARTLVEGQQ